MLTCANIEILATLEFRFREPRIVISPDSWHSSNEKSFPLDLPQSNTIILSSRSLDNTWYPLFYLLILKYVLYFCYIANYDKSKEKSVWVQKKHNKVFLHGLKYSWELSRFIYHLYLLNSNLLNWLQIGIPIKQTSWWIAFHEHWCVCFNCLRQISDKRQGDTRTRYLSWEHIVCFYIQKIFCFCVDWNAVEIWMDLPPASLVFCSNDLAFYVCDTFCLRLKIWL